MGRRVVDMFGIMMVAARVHMTEVGTTGVDMMAAVEAAGVVMEAAVAVAAEGIECPC